MADELIHLILCGASKPPKINYFRWIKDFIFQIPQNSDSIHYSFIKNVSHVQRRIQCHFVTQNVCLCEVFCINSKNSLNRFVDYNITNGMERKVSNE